VHAEADLFPGLIIDRFNDVLVVQANNAGMQKSLPDIAAALDQLFEPKAILLRGDTPARALEQLPSVVEVLKGTLPEQVVAIENGLSYQANVMTGQKTGWFYDQRANRALVARFVKNKSVLDLYTHTGGFGLLAAEQGAASVTCVDSSAPSLLIATQTAKANDLSSVQFEKADVFEYCIANGKKRFEVVVADPPAFAKSKKDINVAAKAYRKLARLSGQLVEKGGFLFIASCSHAMERTRFDEEIAIGLTEAGRTGRILVRTGADMDHPTHPQLSESTYLKGTLLYVD
jgi:23S rRNA (cytosine1962-C5)-methyltransferase